MTPEQKYEFDVKGYLVLKGYFDGDAIQEFHAGIEELQAIPIDFQTYRQLGVASHYLAEAMEDPNHRYWQNSRELEPQYYNPHTGGVWRVDNALCGTDKFDRIVRDEALNDLHRTLAGGPVFISSVYYIEKQGPARLGGRLHNAGYPVDRSFRYYYDHTQQRFLCSSTRSVVILTDMTKLENGPFACIPGSHKANLPRPYSQEVDENPLAVPVFADPGDVVIFTEALTHSAFPVTNNTLRRSVFFNYMPSIERDNLPTQRQSIYPAHVLERLGDRRDMLTAAGYI
jgi:hypothetical protein